MGKDGLGVGSGGPGGRLKRFWSSQLHGALLRALVDQLVAQGIQFWVGVGDLQGQGVPVLAHGVDVGKGVAIALEGLGHAGAILAERDLELLAIGAFPGAGGAIRRTLDGPLPAIGHRKFRPAIEDVQGLRRLAGALELLLPVDLHREVLVLHVLFDHSSR